jgi:hypothetical protein
MTKSSRTLLLGIAGVVVAGGVFAAVLISRHKLGGSVSSDQAIQRAVAALAAGDPDALLQLGDPIGYMAAAFDCSRREARKASKAQRPPDPPANARHRREDDDRDDDDPQKLRDRLQKTYRVLVDKTRGLRIDVAGITERPVEGKGDSKAKGDEVTPGCIARTALTVHQYDVKLRVQDGDKPPTAQDLIVETIEAGGRFYLFQPPEVTRPGSTKDVTVEMEALSGAMCLCKDMACAAKVQADMLAWSQQTAGNPAANPGGGDGDRLRAARKQFSDCYGKLAGDAPAPPPGDPAPPR